MQTKNTSHRGHDMRHLVHKRYIAVLRSLKIQQNTEQLIVQSTWRIHAELKQVINWKHQGWHSLQNRAT